MMTSVHGYFNMITETDMERYRAETFLTKEPETIAWIDDMKPGEVLLDVGANIGIYTMYAASRGITVYAFEPMVENYHHLVRNIEHNAYDKASALPWAIGAGNMRMEKIYLPRTTAGASGGQIEAAMDENGNAFYPAQVRHVLTMGIGEACDLLGLLDTPVHIKIDVDGHEKDICEDMLVNGPFYRRSVLVEINRNAWPLADAVVRFLEWGLTADNEFNRHPQHSRQRRRGTSSEMAENVIFTRR